MVPHANDTMAPGMACSRMATARLAAGSPAHECVFQLLFSCVQVVASFGTVIWLAMQTRAAYSSSSEQAGNHLVLPMCVVPRHAVPHPLPPLSTLFLLRWPTV